MTNNDQDRNRWRIATASALALALTFIDQTAFNVALPTIQRELHLSTALLHWVVNAYLLSLAIFLILGGRLGDRFGKKKIFIVGVSLFALSSIGCGIALRGSVLILSRALQGFGGALMIPNSTAIVMSIFPDNQRGKMMGTLLSFTSIFLMLGPFVGGVLTQYLSWRFVFWLNVPVAIASISLMWKHAPRFISNHVKPIDYLGFVLLAIAVFTLVFALMQGGSDGWLSLVIIVSVVLSILSFIFFVSYSIKSQHPFVELSLFRKSTFNRAVFIYSGMQMTFTFNVFMAIYIQHVLGFKPIIAGLFSIVSLSPVMLFSRFAGRLRDRHGPRFPMKIGLLCLSVGTLWLTCALWTYNIWIIFPGTFGFALAAPFVFGNANTTALSVVEDRFRGMAAGVTACCRQLGGTLSMAVLGAVIVGVSQYYSYMLALTVVCTLVTALAVTCYLVARNL